METISRMPDNFIDSVVTSPPYWMLRDYGYPEQWGMEPTFQEYLEHLWMLMDEVWRVLKPEGTAWINLGDTYSRTGGQGKADPNALVGNQKKGVSKANCNGVDGIEDKCLLLIPHRFAIGCIDRGWIVRNDIIWAKRNGMPESVTDRFSKKHEYFFLMTKSTKYYFDLESIRDKCKPLNRCGGPTFKDNDSKWDKTTGQNNHRDNREVQPNGGMKNPGDVADFWDIPTKPSTADHYATYNDSLLKKPILAGCPEGGIIYDPFMGSGTTAAVCIRSRRNFIGSEPGKNYFKDAQELVIGMLKQPYLL